MRKEYGQIEVVLPKANAELLCMWVRQEWSVEPVCLETPTGNQAVVTLFLPTPAEAHARLKDLPAGLGITYCHVVATRPEQWTTFWRHHFHVQDIGQRLRVVPVWEKAPDRKRINLRMDPGLSFGTGGHFTTRFCLEELERAWRDGHPRSMLDAGTGSGILAIAAAKLGFSRVEAFDFDPVCVAKCAENAALNRMAGNRIRFFVADVLEAGWCRRPAAVVCANILTTVLIRAAPLLWRATARRLILTGIREPEADEVADAFVALGGREIRRDGDGEWCGVVMER